MNALAERHQPSVETFAERKRHNKRIRHGCYGVLTTGLAVIAVGAGRKNWIGVSTTTNQDGSKSFSVAVPDIPTTTVGIPASTLPSDRTDLAGMLHRAIDQKPWCSVDLLVDPKDKRKSEVCGDPSTLKVSKTAPFVVSIGLIAVPVDGQPATDPIDIYSSYAKNPGVCVNQTEQVQTSYRESVSAYTGVSISKLPGFKSIIDIDAAAIDPGIACGSLCLPIRADCQQGSGAAETLPLATVAQRPDTTVVPHG